MYVFFPLFSEDALSSSGKEDLEAKEGRELYSKQCRCPTFI